MDEYRDPSSNMADWDTSSSDTPPPRARSSSTEVLSEIIAAQPQPDDATHLSLPGEEYLAEGDVQVTQEIERARLGSTPPPARVYTRTVNLEVAHMRLQNILAADDDESSQRYSVFQTGEEVDAETRKLEEQVYLRRENMSINWLKERQVPLLYDPKFIKQVLKHPHRYAGLVRPFYLHPPIDFDAPEINFFERQCLRFEEFSRWQGYNRGLGLMEERLLNESYNAALVREAKSAREWLQFMADPSLAHSAGRKEEFWNRRKEERELLRDDRCSNFEEYQASVCARLGRNGVQVHRGFALLADFWEQDRLTMWTEYLAFEHWHKEQYDDDVDEWRAKHDTSYEQLQGKVALRPHESPSYLQTEVAKMERRVEKDRAYNRFDIASLEFAREEQRRPRSQNQEPQYGALRKWTQKMAAAQSEVKASETAKNLVVQREKAIEEYLHETATYREAVDIRSRHDALLEWTKDRYWEIRADAGHLAVARRDPMVSFGQLQETSTEAEEGQEAGQRTHDADPVALSEQQAAAAEAKAEAGATRHDDEEDRSRLGPSSEAPLPTSALQTPPDASPPVSLPPVVSPSPDVLLPVPRPVPSPPTAESSEEPAAVDAALAEAQSIGQQALELASVEEADAQGPLNRPSPVGQSEPAAPAAKPATEAQDPPVSQNTGETGAATPAPTAPPGPRRSERIAKLRQRAAEKKAAAEKAAAEKAAAKNVRASAKPKALPKKRRAAPAKAAAAKAAPAKAATPKAAPVKVAPANAASRKRGRGKAAEEDKEAQDAEPPAKRTRRRTATK